MKNQYQRILQKGKAITRIISNVVTLIYLIFKTYNILEGNFERALYLKQFKNHIFFHYILELIYNLTRSNHIITHQNLFTYHY